MIYVLDSGPLIDLFRHYFEDNFPSLWNRFDSLIQEGRIISVREVLNELKGGNDRLAAWVKANRYLFVPPNADELRFVTEIFAVPHFQAMVRAQERLQGRPVADPFVIAHARQIEGCVVSTEQEKPNSAKIPNVCTHFEVDHTSLHGFMKREGWSF